MGLSGGWGSVSLGRNYTMLYWALFDADLLGPNAFGLSSLDSYIPNTRTDNSLAYRGRFGAWSLGAAYSLGRDAVNAGPSPAGTNCAGESATDRQACRQWSAMLKYDTAPWGFALAVDEMRGGAGAFAGLTRSDLKDRRIMLNGYAALSPTIKLGAGLMRRDNDAAQAASASNGATPRSTLAWGGLSWSPSAAVVVDGQLQQLRYARGGDRSTLLALRATYRFSKRTAVYAQAARIDNGQRLAISVSSAAAGGSPLAGASQTGLMLGLRHSFSNRGQIQQASWASRQFPGAVRRAARRRRRVCDGCGHRPSLHRAQPGRAQASAQSTFFCGVLPGFLEDFVLQGCLAEHALPLGYFRADTDSGLLDIRTCRVVDRRCAHAHK